MSVTNPLAQLRQGSVPLHRQVEDAVRRLLTDASFASGALLPDELTLASKLGVSRGTVRAAILRLVGEGLLERKAGIGTRIVERSTESAIGAWRSFSREMARQGITVQTFRQQLKDVAANAEVAAALRIAKGTIVQRLDRVRGWEALPVLHARSWFHPRVHFTDGEEFSQPLYDVVAKASGLHADRASESFGADSATVALARDLKVPTGSPLLLRRHTVSDSPGRPFEHSEVHYVSKRFTLTIDFKRDTA